MTTKQYQTFKTLHIGQRFEFSSVEEFPYSGMERGPWVKTSARGYRKDTTPFSGDPIACIEHAAIGAMRFTIGSINTGVIPV